MLSRLQRRLSEIYQVGPTHDVRDFVITDPSLAKILGQDAMLTNTQETLLVAHDDDGLALSLFLDADMLRRLEAMDPLSCLRSESLDDLWKVLEGISHFNYIVWKATQERTVTLLELELQGEIDKFVTTMMLALSQADTDLMNSLHGWLFDDVRYHDELEGEQLDRYRSANDYAARFCHGLRHQLVDNEELVLSELRRFYRLQMSDKISHIHAQAFGTS